MGDLVSMRRPAGKGYRGLDDQAPGRPANDLTAKPRHRLDGEEARAELRQLLQWWYYERDRQAGNRLEMAMDHDVYDGMQWTEEDKAILESRNQMALTYNETAPMIDWITGTQRRAPVDWRVLPRAEDDVQAAEVKTKVMKYVADVNKVPFHRSRAFADAAKGGLGWLDDGVRDDPTKEPIYSRYEDWRNVLHDSSCLDLMGEDARYIFRWRWVDEDIAIAMFPDRADVIRREVEEWAYHWDPMDAETDWQPGTDPDRTRGGAMYPLSASSVAVEATRRRVRLIECQYRKPVATKFVGSGPLRGQFFDPRDKALVAALDQVGGTIIDRVAMRVHVAVFTESAMLAMGPSMYRHNQFSLTPVVCFRNGRTRQFYGFVRRVRDVQLDLNKRASKAQFLLNTNQIIMDRGAVDDPDEAHEEAQDPQGKIVVNPGKRFDIRRDTDAATGQVQLMALAAQQIQRQGGVTDENMGRKTNAVSGEAIKARQMQGAVVTTEIFDNLRLSIQTQGQKQLSLCEQFLTEERVIRLTGAQGRLEWVKINRPEVQPDGTVRYLDDITASVADFVVAEADYAGTLRQVMFDSMNQLAQRLPPEIALRFLRIAFQHSDLPNKNEIVDELRKITGEADPDKEMTPEEAAAAEQQMQAQAELMQLQREQAMAALEEQRGKAREVHARAEKILSEIGSMGAGGGEAAALQQQIEFERAVAQVREQGAREIEKLSQALARAQADTTSAVLKIRTEADTALEAARIKADSDERIAEIQAANDRQMEALLRRLDDLAGTLAERTGELSKLQRSVESIEKERLKKEAEDRAEDKSEGEGGEKGAPAAAAAPAAPPVTVVVQPAAAAAKVVFEHGKDGKPKAAVLKREDGTEVRVDVETKPADGARKDDEA